MAVRTQQHTPLVNRKLSIGGRRRWTGPRRPVLRDTETCWPKPQGYRHLLAQATGLRPEDLDLQPFFVPLRKSLRQLREGVCAMPKRSVCVCVGGRVCVRGRGVEDVTLDRLVIVIRNTRASP